MTSSSSPPSSCSDSDQMLTATGDMAAAFRMEVVKLGWFRDPYLCCFLDPTQGRRSFLTEEFVLLTNLYFQRMTAIRGQLERFLLSSSADRGERKQRVQILNLGCGFDTGFFQMHDWVEEQGLGVDIRWYDLDFPPTIRQKSFLISTHPLVFQKSLSDFNFEGDHSNLSQIITKHYSALPLDLRSIPDRFPCKSVDPSAITLALSDFVISYLDQQDVGKILSWITQTFQRSSCLIFEPLMLGEGDRFSASLQAKFCVSGFPLRIFATSDPPLHSIEAWIVMFQTCGFSMVTLASDLETHWHTHRRETVPIAELNLCHHIQAENTGFKSRLIISATFGLEEKAWFDINKIRDALSTQAQHHWVGLFSRRPKEDFEKKARQRV